MKTDTQHQIDACHGNERAIELTMRITVLPCGTVAGVQLMQGERYYFTTGEGVGYLPADIVEKQYSEQNANGLAPEGLPAPTCSRLSDLPETNE